MYELSVGQKFVYFHLLLMSNTCKSIQKFVPILNKFFGCLLFIYYCNLKFADLNRYTFSSMFSNEKVYLFKSAHFNKWRYTEVIPQIYKYKVEFTTTTTAAV